jgi:hypothetical protein
MAASAPPGEHHVAAPRCDQAGGLADGVGARGAGAGGAVVDAAEAEAHGDLPAPRLAMVAGMK